MSKYLWGIDLGGTKIEGVILDNDNANQIILRQRKATEADQGYQHVITQITALVREMEEASGISCGGLGIGTPGRLDPASQTLKNSNTVCFNGQAFQKDLEKSLGFPIKIENDANCFAMSEANYLFSQGVEPSSVILGLILGTGVGGGVIINGRPITGRHGIGGEWGHNILDPSGGDCYCGQVGCVETIISGPSLQRFYHSLSGNQKSMAEIVGMTEDLYAQQTMDRLHHFFGKGLSSLINVLDPDYVVIGGGLSNIDSLYTEGVAQLKKYVFNDSLETLFVKPHHGDSSGVLGAAML